LLPSETKRAEAAWNSFDEAQAAFDKIAPHQTTLAELKKMGFDPRITSNVKVLTYLDLIERFLPNASLSLKDLQPDVRTCIEAKDDCHAFELAIDQTQNKRYGNVCLDVFGFKQKTRVTGWRFKALIILKDDVVAYKLRSGEPNVLRFEKKLKPLGPLQELDRLLMKGIDGMM
jgi:hypothetical protein